MSRGAIAVLSVAVSPGKIFLMARELGRNIPLVGKFCLGPLSYRGAFGPRDITLKVMTTSRDLSCWAFARLLYSATYFAHLRAEPARRAILSECPAALHFHRSVTGLA
jgi:hypothetical protein